VRSLWRDGARVREVELDAVAPGRWRVRVDDAEFEVAAEALADGRMTLRSDAGENVAEVTPAGTRRFVRLGTLEFVIEREASARARPTGAPQGMTAPMPGVVTRVLAGAGDTVTRGQPLVALEAMKMEHLIRAPRDGRVKSVHAEVGAMVQGGATLAELEPEPGA